MLNSLFKAISVDKIPLDKWVSDGVDNLKDNFGSYFDGIKHATNHAMDSLNHFLLGIPAPVMIIGVTLLALLTMRGKKFGFPIFVAVGLLFVWNQQLWTDLVGTLSLVIASAGLSLIIGVPLGIIMAKSRRTASVITPLLDLMQTMPAFVYLIPAVAFFGIGSTPGIFASIVFALPPVVRMTNLGIRQVPTDLIEAADSFGSTKWQKLFKVELPTAKNTILAGANQTIMLALSMVVIASMIGAEGLGKGVVSAVQHANVGEGFVNGISLVILAIIIDRFTQKLSQSKQRVAGQHGGYKRLAIIAILVAMAGFGTVQTLKNNNNSGPSLTIGYVEWDSEVASTNVLAEAMNQHGYNVKIKPLDNAVLWQAAANSEVDASISAWLPTTHKALLDKYQDKLTVTGTNLEGVQTGLAVPEYMNVNSIEDLSNQADKTIVGIEPGAGIMTSAEKTLKSYDNLSGWKIQSSSTGAMPIAFDKAYKDHKDIIVTGWSPHWMFSKYKMKYLKDPKGTMGKSEHVATITRKNLQKDNPEAYQVLKNFKWDKEDMQSVMLDINNGTKPEAAAKKWIKEHQSQVDAWFK